MLVELMTCLLFVLQGLYSVCVAHDLIDVCVTGAVLCLWSSCLV